MTGCIGLRDFAKAYTYLCKGDEIRAFLCIDGALRAHRSFMGGMIRAGHGIWQGFYRNECFSNVRLTVQVLEATRSWLRVCFDGDNFYKWEKEYLTPVEDTRVACLTHRTNQLDDDSLADALRMSGKLF